MKIQILGRGCTKCNMLEDNAKKAINELNIDCTIEKITDPDEIVDFGVMMTPALAINNEVKSAGKLLTSDQIIDLITKENI